MAKETVQETVQEVIIPVDVTKTTRTVRLPRAERGEEDSIFVSVNGKNYQVKKGVDVVVPYPVYEILQQREDAIDAQRAYEDEKGGE